MATLIALAGLPGVGKTAIAREFARALQAVYLRIDTIEQAVRDAGPLEGSLDDAGYRMAYAIARDNLLLGHSVIADCVNPIALTRDAWVAVAREAGADALEVEIICSDAAEHRRRVEVRDPDIAGLRLPTWDDVIARRYESWTRDRIVIDTARQSPRECAALVLKQLGKDPAALNPQPQPCSSPS